MTSPLGPGPSAGTVRELVRSHVRAIDDFPTPGVLFRDITPLLADADAFNTVIDYLAKAVRSAGADLVVGIEARGFILAAPVAIVAGVGFIPLRKPGKLPGVTLRESYALEYGEAALEMHEDAIVHGTRVVLMDDVLATGGTAGAAAGLLERAGADVVKTLFLIELASLEGRATLGPRPMEAILTLP
ncbi:MAG: adenine phosphoribosyltransferase [Bifidobacteriaceae bacterium]|jgi:adenine phosphoribosyltransferase|nr:adenine phosphoribosyltransferase [Bifidobacteriaceae bacterium]